MQTAMTPTNLRDHAQSLATLFGITLVYSEKLKYEEAGAIVFDDSSPEAKRALAEVGCTKMVVRARAIIDEATYAVVMHEIGHHLAPNGHCLLKDPKPGCHPRDRYEWLAAKLVAEEAAWEWAQYYIEQVFVWTAAMEQVKRYGLGTYERGRRMGR